MIMPETKEQEKNEKNISNKQIYNFDHYTNMPAYMTYNGSRTFSLVCFIFHFLHSAFQFTYEFALRFNRFHAKQK